MNPLIEATIDGVKVLVPCEPGTDSIRSCIAILREQGFSFGETEAKLGEHKSACGWIMRTTQRKNGRTTPVLHLYAPENTWPTTKMYLNHPHDEQTFEDVTGVLLRNIPEWPADTHIQRGTGKDQYIVQVSRPCSFFFKDNPKYDPNETDLAKKKTNGPARKFVRWDGQAAPTPQGNPTLPATPAKWEGDLRQKCFHTLGNMHVPVSDFNALFASGGPITDHSGAFRPVVPEDSRGKLMHMIGEYTANRGWIFDGTQFSEAPPF